MNVLHVKYFLHVSITPETKCWLLDSRVVIHCLADFKSLWSFMKNC